MKAKEISEKVKAIFYQDKISKMDIKKASVLIDRYKYIKKVK